MYENYQYIWDAIGSLRPGNLAERFDLISTRFQNGRVNELVRFYFSQAEKSSYAEFVLEDEMGLRYSSVSTLAFYLVPHKNMWFFADFRTHQKNNTQWNMCMLLFMGWGSTNSP